MITIPDFHLYDFSHLLRSSLWCCKWQWILRLQKVL